MSAPPLGLRPKWIHDHVSAFKRANDIIDAMQRYADVGVPVPSEWVVELRMRTNELARDITK